MSVPDRRACRPCPAELRPSLAREPIDMRARGAGHREARVSASSIRGRRSRGSRELGDRAARCDSSRWRGASGRDGISAHQPACSSTEEGFAGNRAHYDDFRNSLLNVVLERRLGIPITLGARLHGRRSSGRRRVQGVAFPGRFLLRGDARSRPGHGDLDPFSGGVELDDDALPRAAGEIVGRRRRTIRRCCCSPCTSRAACWRACSTT